MNDFYNFVTVLTLGCPKFPDSLEGGFHRYNNRRGSLAEGSYGIRVRWATEGVSGRPAGSGDDNSASAIHFFSLKQMSNPSVERCNVWNRQGTFWTECILRPAQSPSWVLSKERAEDRAGHGEPAEPLNDWNVLNKFFGNTVRDVPNVTRQKVAVGAWHRFS